jgi:photosystem II stability/assembly factor-like uncharacterized protein
MSKKQLISGIFFFLLLLLAGNASSEVEPIYAGWTVGDSWGDGSGTSYGTILRSTDSGNTWIRQGEGQIANVGMAGVFAVDPYTAWVVGKSDSGYGTIYHTTDGGSTWERKGSPDTASADYVPDVDLGKVHAAGDDVWIVTAHAILHTSDGGATWTNRFPAGYDENIHILQGVYALDSNTVWVTGSLNIGDDKIEDVILKTTDAGQTWTRQSYVFDKDQYPPGYFLGISATDADTAWAVGNNYTILKTTNGGATWTKEPNWPYYGIPYDLNEVYAVSTSTVWVAGDFDIYWTHDGGQSWDEGKNHGLYCGDLAVMGISAVSADEAWASHYAQYGAIFHTADGGNTWTTIDQIDGEDLPGLWTISFATQPINPNYLIISLIGDVEQLVDDGLLNKGQGNALIVKLDQALVRLADDRLKAAINALDAFSNQVDAFVRGGVLPPETGQNFSDQVNYIIEILRFSP